MGPIPLGQSSSDEIASSSESPPPAAPLRRSVEGGLGSPWPWIIVVEILQQGGKGEEGKVFGIDYRLLSGTETGEGFWGAHQPQNEPAIGLLEQGTYPSTPSSAAGHPAHMSYSRQPKSYSWLGPQCAGGRRLCTASSSRVEGGAASGSQGSTAGAAAGSPAAQHAELHTAHRSIPHGLAAWL